MRNDNDIAEMNALTCNKDEKQCCSVMFKLWLERQPGASWRQLIDALRAIRLDRVASDVEKLLQQHENALGKRKCMCMFMYGDIGIRFFLCSTI